MQCATNTGCVHNQQSDFVRRDRSSPMKKNAFVRFITVTHTITSVIISHNTSVPMTGHLELAIGTLTSHAYKNLANKSDFSQTPLSRSGFDCKQILIVNKFNQIRFICFDCECNHYNTMTHTQGGPKKTGPFLNVDNFAMVSGRKACDMSKVCKFWTNHVCKRSLLFRCVSSENSLIYALSVIVSVISGIVNIYAN